MKKIFISAVILCLMMTGFAQQQVSDFVLNVRMHEQFSQSEIDHYYHNDFAELFRLNYKMTNYATVTTKLESNHQVLGPIEKYAKKGVTIDEDYIVATGFINPFNFDFPQDENKVNVFTLHHSGYYVVVLPKGLYNERMEAQLHQYVY